MDAYWYLRRLSMMGPAEIAGRTATAVRVRRFRHLSTDAEIAVDPHWRFTATLPAGALAAVSPQAAADLRLRADELLEGRAEYFGVTRDDLADPDWHFDPRTGRRAPAEEYAFDIAYRDEQAVGDIKQLWEPSRHQHLTVLAAAYAVTRDERYAERVGEHLRSWWQANPPLRGVHWLSGIELGIRLLSWVWVRRLLDGWPQAAGLFEGNPEFRRQLYWHQRWLAAFTSHGSSANNHVIAEAAGQLAAACAFDFYPASARWRADALRLLDKQLQANTFDSGLNRELATEYHGLVLELGLAALAEARAAGLAVPESTENVLLRMTDALAAIVDGCDEGLRPPRQGDADDGYGLVVDGAGADRWSSLLATGDALFGRLPWWPKPPGGDVRTAVLAAVARPHKVESPGGGLRPAARPPTDRQRARPARRPAQFADAGMTILRAGSEDAGEIWCRCDGGPHGFLSIAAHAHADALSVELRHDGVDVLADPGTYCYHGEPEWRSYFRSTLGHNTLQLNGRDQSVSGGPFLWTEHATTRVLAVDIDEGGVSRWQAAHDGYASRRRPVLHRRTAELDAVSRELRLLDEVRSPGSNRCTLAFHLGPTITAELLGETAWLSWTHRDRHRTAVLALPPELAWTAHRGETDPPLGWYSAGFGRREPATTLLGAGRSRGTTALQTLLRFTS